MNMSIGEGTTNLILSALSTHKISLIRAIQKTVSIEMNEIFQKELEKTNNLIENIINLIIKQK